MSGSVRMHASITTRRLVANHHLGNEIDHQCIVEGPDAPIIKSVFTLTMI